MKEDWEVHFYSMDNPRSREEVEKRKKKMRETRTTKA
jgi:hypothetical protein